MSPYAVVADENPCFGIENEIDNDHFFCVSGFHSWIRSTLRFHCDGRILQRGFLSTFKMNAACQVRFF